MDSTFESDPALTGVPFLSRPADTWGSLVYDGRLCTVDFPIAIFFLFLEIFLSFSEKNKFRHFFMSQIIFQSEKLVGRKNFKKQIGEIKKNYEKNFDREKFIK